ncbi:uncharacterized protein [Rutidosis leptorrhynchoides]|uniref:uncharacterized protein n=1 Tax=Rutidosis leptorrhynchoides TaxID=125765 RepID=UPI003A999C23
MSLNIRGFGIGGPDDKVGWVRRLISKEKPSFLALQETRLNIVEDRWIHYLWGSTECCFIQLEMVGLAGGQLLIWDTNCFEALDVIRFNVEWVIGVQGKWKDSGEGLNVINVHGPHDDEKKVQLWDELSLKLANNNEAVILCGDFNEVRHGNERFNCEFVEYRARRFNDFISNNCLLDIPMGGRNFTRVSDDGVKFSKLDRF